MPTLLHRIGTSILSIQQKYQQSIFVIIASWGMFALLGWLVLQAIISPEYPQYASIMVPCALLAVGVVASLTFIPGKIIQPIVDLVSKFGVLVGIFAVLLGVHVLVALSLMPDVQQVSWDAGIVARSAIKSVAAQGFVPDYPSYFMVASNNIGLWLVLTAVLYAAQLLGFHDASVVSVVVNVLVMNISFWLMYAITRQLWGRGAAAVTLMFGVVFITLSMWSITFYSDTLGMFFPLALLFCALRLKPATKLSYLLIWAILFGSLTYAGYLIKPTVVLFTLALLLVGLFYAVYQRQKVATLLATPHIKRLLWTSGSAVAGIAGVALVWHGIVLNIIQVGNESLTPSHYMMMGLRESCFESDYGQSVCHIGGWNAQDAAKHIEFATMREYEEYTVAEIQRRLAAYGWDGYADYLTSKGAWVVGDGTFFAYGEGNGREVAMVSDLPFSDPIQAFMHPSGPYFSTFTILLQTAWLAVLLLVLISYLLPTLRHDSITSSIRISLLGILLFLLLFEARSRYLYLYVPFFIMLAGYGAVSLKRQRWLWHKH